MWYKKHQYLAHFARVVLVQDFIIISKQNLKYMLIIIPRQMLIE
jgi:hypothetical protein